MDPRMRDEIKYTNELASELTIGEIDQLKFLIQFPMGLCEGNCDGASFLLGMRKWQNFDPYIFSQALTTIGRIDLLTIICKITWLCASQPRSFTEEYSMKSLLTLLRTEITKREWKIVAVIVYGNLEGEEDFESIITACLSNQLITNLKALQELFSTINRLDVSDKLRKYETVFAGMAEDEFIFKMKRELVSQTTEIAEWDNKLKSFLENQYTLIQQMIGKSELVDLAHIYVDLTIVKQEPREVNYDDETTYNEISFLRKIANQEIQIQPVNFTTELTSYKATVPEIWCLIGNPGCGKTFLAKRTALRFGKNELKNIRYSISIPCRNTDWHSMELARIEGNKTVTPEFVQEWLCLGLPVLSEWSKDLSKHLSNTNGEGLMLIIDGLDECIKTVKFEETLLFFLLTRQTLHRSTIILTTRPGAWTEHSSKNEFKVNRYYQVLGFSPRNRNLFFKKQLNEAKFREYTSLLEKYDEISQLSLIPVNASLFAALLKDESVTINNLTHLYSELTCYLIRRQLIRMGLKKYAEVTKLQLFHLSIQNCLYTIGIIALVGVSRRELTSTEKVSISIDEVEKESHCLGLAHEYHKKEAVGTVKKVWAFAHLTMQEFIGAIFLNSTSWTHQCLSVRYIADSNENFSQFMMVVRFLCGLLCEKSAAVLTILYRLSTRQTIQDLPMYYLLRYEHSSLALIRYTGWYEFTKKYFQLSPILFETNSISINKSFTQLLPDSICIYLTSQVLPVAPYEWTCFLQSLSLIHHIQLIYVDTNALKLIQFRSLLNGIRQCPLNYLSLTFEKGFSPDQDPISNKILSYTDAIANTELDIKTKISIELHRCEVMDLPFFSNINAQIASLRLFENTYTENGMQKISENLFLRLNYLSLDGSINKYKILLPTLHRISQLRGLYTTYIPKENNQLFLQSLPLLSQLTEICYTYYSILDHIVNLSGIRYLELRSVSIQDNTLSDSLLQIINNNKQTLRGLHLWNLDAILSDLSLFLNALQVCVNLVKLELSFISIKSGDITEWGTTVNKLKLLIQLNFLNVKLYDTGFLSLCQGLVYHPAIKYLLVSDCGQTSISCEVLINLIPTVSQLLVLRVNDLSKPDSKQILILESLANEYSISALLH